MGRILQALADNPLLAGMARSMDLFGTFNRPNLYHGRDPAQADAEAFASDWAAVGADLWAVTLQPGEQRRATVP